jgi:PAS domain S-box-containing protein
VARRNPPERVDLAGYLKEFARDARRQVRVGVAPTVALRGLIDAAPFAALIADDSGRYVLANRAASRLTGYSGAELRGLSVWDLTPRDDEHDADVLWRAFLQQRAQTGVHPIRTKPGKTVNAQYAAQAHLLKGLHVSLLHAPSKLS